jgi:hypothetical protein
MSDEHGHPDIKRLWQSQAVESTPMSLGELQSALSKLNRTVRFRTLVLGLMCLLLIGGFGPQIFTASSPIMRGSACLLVIGAGYLLYHVILGRRRGSGQLAIGREPEACAAFYRSEIEWQRDFHHRIGVWFTPVACAPVVVFLFRIRELTSWQFTATMMVLAAFLIVVGVVANLRRVREYQRELDTLNVHSGQ